MAFRLQYSQYTRSNWNLEMVVFEEKGEPELWEENFSKQGPERTKTNLTGIP